jgi:hypothetical protein
MKTLREVLLAKHQAAGPKLDTLRERVIARLSLGRSSAAVPWSQTAGEPPPAALALAPGLRQFLWSLRWHVAGLSAAWIVILVLSIGDGPRTVQIGRNRRETPHPQQSLAALRESHRQLRELLEAPAKAPAPEPPKATPTPQSQFHPPSTAAA